MNTIKFYNHNNYSIRVSGPNNELIKFNRHEEKTLPEYYKKYTPKYLTIKGQSTGVKPAIAPVRKMVGFKEKKQSYQLDQAKTINKINTKETIGIGILSYNRKHCIERLIKSIEKYTDLNNITLFVSDESENEEIRNWLKTKNYIISLPYIGNIGIAGNSNKLLQCLNRFDKKLLLNDDIEILKAGWENTYFEAMKQANHHHFCYQQDGIYGMNRNKLKQSKIGNTTILTVDSKPHGAVMAFDKMAQDTVKYFDESFGPYGVEHIDWSNRVSLSGIQPIGYHDIQNSDQYFKIHNEKTSTSKENLKVAKEKFEIVKNDTARIKINIQPKLPEINYIIPMRITPDRINAVKSSINCIKNQQFPAINIILVEQGPEQILPESLFIYSEDQFNKSQAFNYAVQQSSEYMVLYDADMLVNSDYTSKIYNILLNYEACHIGSRVLYMDQNNSEMFMHNNNPKVHIDYIVNYYEGGSLGIRKSVYEKIGGFNEDFVGYGVEDCEFYERIKQLSTFYGIRTEDLVHLWHGRTEGWEQCHEINKTKHNILKKQTMETRIKNMSEKYRKKYNENSSR